MQSWFYILGVKREHAIPRITWWLVLDDTHEIRVASCQCEPIFLAKWRADQRLFTDSLCSADLNMRRAFGMLQLFVTFVIFQAITSRAPTIQGPSAHHVS